MEQVVAVASAAIVQVVVAVGATEGADPWWHDLVDFLRAEGVVPDRLPPCVTGVDPAALLPVYLGANRVLRELWDADPFNIHFVGIEGRVRRGQRLFTGGPIVWGLRVSDDGCEWWVAIGNAGHPGVSVTYDAVVDAARAGGLPDTWLPSEDYLWDRFLVFDKRRAFVAGEHTDDVVRLFFSPAFRELHAARMLKPHFDKTREKQARDSQRRTERERGKAGPLTT